ASTASCWKARSRTCSTSCGRCNARATPISAPMRKSARFFLPSRFLTRLLQVANLGIHPHVLAPALGEELARLEIVAFHGKLGRALELVRPFTERVAEPRRLGLELGQAQLLPDYLRALHVLALGQRDRREI